MLALFFFLGLVGPSTFSILQSPLFLKIIALLFIAFIVPATGRQPEGETGQFRPQIFEKIISLLDTAISFIILLLRQYQLVAALRNNRCREGQLSGLPLPPVAGPTSAVP